MLNTLYGMLYASVAKIRKHFFHKLLDCLYNFSAMPCLHQGTFTFTGAMASNLFPNRFLVKTGLNRQKQQYHPSKCSIRRPGGM